ncbi:MAG: hypothetical protein L0287_30015 [Anaerolineae bacterium]|nr:hypothetical protein [Anaerolineae bacterium]MCI0608139.1 hypothetical protein [Anaerolineae bacterium]
MLITQPSRLTFWRLVFALTALLPFLSVWQLLNLAPGFGIDIPSSRSWMQLLIVLGLMGIPPLLLLTLTWSRYQERILSLVEFPERLPEGTRWIRVLFLIGSVVGFTFAIKLPFIIFLAGVGWFRFLVFWYFNLLGIFALKSIRRDVPWLMALISIALCQAVFHLLLFYWTRVTDYPFAMGWSETSRFYHPSLFLSESVYGQKYAWPVLHPTLHLLLTPPYLFDAPLWVHRFWQVAIRYILLAAVVPALMMRLSIQGAVTRWLVGIWMFLFLFMGPVYFHLTIPVILVLLGFSHQNDRRTWVAVILASIWCGWSRVNWYPMSGMIAAVLYLLEVPFSGKNIWRYLLTPALWFVIGTLIAFASQRVYITMSGVPDSGLFYTSFTSNLLWYRLLPNASYFLGILPAAILASLPIWLAMYVVIRSRKEHWHPIRLTFIFAALLLLFLGGLAVSLKIGGGANLHNMDAYMSMLLIVFAYLIFARYRAENGELAQPVPLPWMLAVALIIMPAWSYLQFGIDFKSVDRVRTQKIMTWLQEHVDEVNAQGGEVLFITQRQLISMHMLNNVTLVPEYEREDLMEMAMADNLPYLARFRDDIGNQRFALIVVDPLNDAIMRRDRVFPEENNVWVRRVVRTILCNYREEAVYPLHEIALYVPQEGERSCP